MNFRIVLLDGTTVTGGGAAAEAAVTSGETSAGTEAAPVEGGGLFGSAGITTILIYGGLLAALYFFMFRPQRKREKEMKEMQASIGVGDNVITSSGLYGVVTALGEDCFVIEFGSNRGVRIPVRKSDVVGIKTPALTPVNKEKEEKS
jgi:preprotein translocase subunit YajC